MKDVKWMCLCILSILNLYVAGCQDSIKEMSIKYSEKKYQMVSAYDEGMNKYVFRYNPVPDKIIPIEAKIISIRKPLVDSMSISQEKTKTTFKILYDNTIPNNPQVNTIILTHFTYVINPPLSKDDLVELLFDSEGNFIDVRRLHRK